MPFIAPAVISTEGPGIHLFADIFGDYYAIFRIAYDGTIAPIKLHGLHLQKKKRKMRIIGLTGGIASGKSTIASWFSYRGFPVFDSDKMVHRLMGPKGIAVPAILSKFDDCGGYGPNR